MRRMLYKGDKIMNAQISIDDLKKIEAGIHAKYKGSPCKLVPMRRGNDTGKGFPGFAAESRI